MIVRRALWQTACGFCVVGAIGLSALAATSLDDATQADVNRGTINLDRTPAKAAPERTPMGNPLWAIPLGSLSITRDRPLLTPSRRPPAPAVIATPRIAPPKVVIRPMEPEHPNLALIGTVVSETEGIGVFLDQATNNFIRIKTGEGHAGWILKSIKAHEATLEKGPQTETLRLQARKDFDPTAPVRGDDPL